MKIRLGKAPQDPPAPPPFPGSVAAMDGSAAVVAMETAASEGAGAYPITPSTQMGEGWAAAVAEGRPNANGRPLLFFEPEGEHAAAAVTAGMSMTGLRATNFSSGQGIAYMHESLYAAVGKRLTYVLNIAARAITKHALNVHAGHDDYHAVDDTGFFQLFAKSVQEAADLTLVAHRIAELSLNPGICAQDGFLTSHAIESMRLPEAALVRRFLGDPADEIDSPTPAQRLVFGARRRRIPELFDVDAPAMVGVVQNQDSYAQGVAAQRPFYFDHLAELTDRAFAEYAALTGRRYARAQGYRLEDAEYVIVGQGSVVSNAEVVADHLRATRGLKVGVLNLTMFRPFPADLVTELLKDKRGVVVLERTDQPLAVDPPLLREIRAAMTQGVENGRAVSAAPRARGDRASAPVVSLPFPGLAALAGDEVPDFYSGCFGLGSRDLQPADIVAAVENMLPTGTRRRRFYLGIEFIREGTRLPKLQIWQEQVTEAYPHVSELALAPAAEVNLLPPGAVSLRIHSVGGWGAITMGKNLAMTAFELFGLHIKANPKYGSEKKGQPTTFYATLAKEPVRLNCELKHVNVVLSPDPNVFRNSDPLAGLAEDGVFVIQSDAEPEKLWASLPAAARRTIVERRIRVFALDAFRIAGDEATDPELRFRMQGAAFMGAFFARSPLVAQAGMDEARLFEGIRAQLARKFGKLGEKVVEANLRVIQRGFREIRPVDTAASAGDGRGEGRVVQLPVLMNVPGAADGIANPGRFWEQVCHLYKSGQDVIADPFVALSAIPAATSAVRDMTDVRMEVPRFIPEKCTGCAQCWTQCPDAAIPGLVTEIETLIATGIDLASRAGSVDRVRQLVKPLGKEIRKQMQGGSSTSFAALLDGAYRAVADRAGWDAERRATADAEIARVAAVLADFPVARTKPFFDVPEGKQAGTGGLLAITVNPDACKGCNLCVAVCPDGALETVKQDDAIVERLRHNWRVWEALPDTPDRYVNVASIEEGIGVLPSLLLKKGNYRSMAGGDGACMGCGEKTAVHLIVSSVHALMQPRVQRFVARLEELIADLDLRARRLLASDADLGAAARAAGGTVPVALDDAKRRELERLSRTLDELKALRWRYLEGPGGRGRAKMAMANSTGCSSVWASTYPYNPYPFPWVNHLFQDSPSVAIGIFEGHMRKMADAFATVRRAELLRSGEYDAERHEKELSRLAWGQFTDEEFALCPPILAMGGDGAMLDIGFQNLSRLMASGKPIRVVVLDTQVYSNTGGQACTSGYTGQISDMATYGKLQHGKQEVRKELALIAMAHRGVFVHQTSQAAPSHLIAGVLKGLQSKRPALFNIYTPCPVEHGLADDWALHAARLALEGRAFPFLTYDPDAGSSVADCLSLDGNPAVDAAWPTYRLEYVDDAGATRSLELPLTTADWAATEGRFKKHFRPVRADAAPDDLVPFHEYLALSAEERAGKTPFIHTLAAGKKLSRLEVSAEMVRLAEERQGFWNELRELAGLAVSPALREQLVGQLETEFEAKVRALAAEYETRIADLQRSYPQAIARRLAEALVRAADGQRTIADLVASLPAVVAPSTPAPGSENGHGAALAMAVALAKTAPAATETPGAPVASAPAAAAPLPAAAPAAAAEEGLAMEAYIDSDRCTSCNECTNLNAKLFAYNANKQATVKDARAGTFAQLVTAAEHCPVSAIHPGTPVNPNEKDLAKWTKRAERFN